MSTILCLAKNYNKKEQRIACLFVCLLKMKIQLLAWVFPSDFFLFHSIILRLLCLCTRHHTLYFVLGWIVATLTKKSILCQNICNGRKKHFEEKKKPSMLWIENDIETEASTHEKWAFLVDNRIQNFVSKQHQFKLISSHFYQHCSKIMIFSAIFPLEIKPFSPFVRIICYDVIMKVARYLYNKLIECCWIYTVAFQTLYSLITAIRDDVIYLKIGMKQIQCKKEVVDEIKHLLIKTDYNLDDIVTLFWYFILHISSMCQPVSLFRQNFLADT